MDPQENFVRAQFIKRRIDELLVEENFFFYKIFKDSEKDLALKNGIEQQEIIRLVHALSTFGKCYM